MLTNAGFTLQTTTPGGRVRIARTDLHLYDAGQRSGPPHAVTGVDVVAQFGDKTYLATVTVQTTDCRQPHLCAGLPRQSSRDSRCCRPPRPTTAKSAYARPVAEGRRRRRAHRSTRLRRVPRRARPRHRRPQHGGGHTSWTCRVCDQTVCGPPLNSHCTTLAGPATVRISTRRDQIAQVAGPNRVQTCHG